VKADEIRERLSGQWGDAIRTLAPGLSDALQKGKKHQPCPLCGGTDRFNFDANFQLNGKAHCNKKCSLNVGGGIDLLMAWNNWEFQVTLDKLSEYLGVEVTRKVSQKVTQKPPPKKDYVKQILSECSDMNFKLEEYLKFRGLSGVAHSLKFHSSLYHKTDKGTFHEPALVAPLKNLAGETTGIQRIYLNNEGKGKSENKPNKMIMKDSDLSGSSVHFGEPVKFLQIAEGVETALAIYEMTGKQPTWASVSATLMGSMEIPEGVEQVWIYGDNDDAGWENSQKLGKRLVSHGVKVFIKMPPKGEDWLDRYVKHGKETLQHAENMGNFEVLPDEIPEEKQEKDGKEKESENNEFEQDNLKLYTSAELVDGDFEEEFLINSFLIEKQPMIISGPEKTLKTTILVQMAIALASGKPFLGKFSVKKKCKVLFLSAESGLNTLKKNAMKMCETMGIELRDLEIIWCAEVTNLEDPESIKKLERATELHKPDLTFFDPVYFMMPTLGGNAGNVFEVNSRLQKINDYVRKYGVTPVIVHHSNLDKANPHNKPRLSDVSWAGFKQWARQWIIIGRRSYYDDKNLGFHELNILAGGSSGHSSSWEVNIQEGGTDINESGGVEGSRERKWHVDFPEVKNDHETSETSKNKVQRDKIASDAERVLKYLQLHTRGRTMKKIRDECGLGLTAAGEATKYLLEGSRILTCLSDEKGNPTMYKIDDSL